MDSHDSEPLPAGARFTIADYTYDRWDSEGAAERDNWPQAGPSSEPQQTYYTPGSLRPLPQSNYHLSTTENKMSTASGSTSRTLRLHQHDMGEIPFGTELKPLPSLGPDYEPSTSPISHFSPTAHPQPALPQPSQDGHAEQPFESDARSVRSVQSRITDANSVAGGRGKSFDFADKAGALTGSPLVTRRRWWKLGIDSWACRALLAVVICESLIDISIEANILWRFNNEVESDSITATESLNRRRLPVLLVIFGLAHLWQLILTVIAVRTRNTIQVVAVTAFNFAFLAYAVIEIYELREILGSDLSDELKNDGDDSNDSSSSDTSSLLTLPLNVLTGVIIGVIALSCCLLAGLAWKLRQEFGWERYRFLGADLQIRKFYTRFQIFECIAYFSAFFCAGFGIQFLFLVLQKTDAEYVVTWVMFPVSVLVLVMGRFAAKYEFKWAMGGFMFGLVLGLAYFIFKLVRIWQADSIYSKVAMSLTLFDVLSMLSLLACLISGGIVWRNFGRGLKGAVLSQARGKQRSTSPAFWHSPSSEKKQLPPEKIEMESPRRISID